MTTGRPVIMYACIHNSGRSVAAKVLTEHYAGDGALVRSAGSAGSEPGVDVNAAVTAVLAERGLSTAGHRPSLLTRDVLEDSDVVVTMGCGETCPTYPGKRYEDWQVQDPKDRDLDAVRAIVDDIDSRVRVLLVDLGVRVQG